MWQPTMRSNLRPQQHGLFSQQSKIRGKKHSLGMRLALNLIGTSHGGILQCKEKLLLVISTSSSSFSTPVMSSFLHKQNYVVRLRRASFWSHSDSHQMLFCACVVYWAGPLSHSTGSLGQAIVREMLQVLFARPKIMG